MIRDMLKNVTPWQQSNIIKEGPTLKVQLTGLLETLRRPSGHPYSTPYLHSHPLAAQPHSQPHVATHARQAQCAYKFLNRENTRSTTRPGRVYPTSTHSHIKSRCILPLTNMATGQPSALLLQAIDNADADVLRIVLKSMCKSSSECSKQASQRLLAASAKSAPGKRKTVIDLTDEPVSAKKKQKLEEEGGAPAVRFKKCLACEAQFDVTKNHKKACRTHEGKLLLRSSVESSGMLILLAGELEIDEDMFPDDDEVMYTTINVKTDWRVKSCPDGFIWSCCEGNAESAPCLLQKHVAM